MIKIKKPKTATIKVSSENMKILDDLRIALQKTYGKEMKMLGIERLVMDDAVTAALRGHMTLSFYPSPQYEANSRFSRVMTQGESVEPKKKEA